MCASGLTWKHSYDNEGATQILYRPHYGLLTEQSLQRQLVKLKANIIRFATKQRIIHSPLSACDITICRFYYVIMM
jgi:hypothetical protein